jgi:hypothetical protein
MFTNTFILSKKVLSYIKASVALLKAKYNIVKQLIKDNTIITKLPILRQDLII